LRVTSIERLTEFGRDHPDARRALAAWLRTTTNARWRSLTDVRGTYRHADGVKVAGERTMTIFNIRGNNYRLLTTVDYQLSSVNVLQVLTHAQYDKEKWKGTL